MNNTLTTEQVYTAMFSFLDDYYNRTKSDDVGGLLGGMSLMNDDKPMDMAIWRDWLESVAKVQAGQVDAYLKLTDTGPPSA